MSMRRWKNTMKPISFWRRLLDLIAPRLCVVCRHRLSVTEEIICSKCNFHLPRTEFHLNAYDNEMARLFWAQIPIQRATAFFYYEPHAETANIIYELKYKNRPEIGTIISRMLAKEIQPAGFFDEIDGIVPVPLAKKRLHQRGYNQSEEIAQGISEITGLPVLNSSMPRLSATGICCLSMMSSPLVPPASPVPKPFARRATSASASSPSPSPNHNSLSEILK